VILPSKHISPERSLLGVGSRVLAILDRPETVSTVWDRFQAADRAHSGSTAVTFDWFVLALDMLYAMGRVDFSEGRVRRIEQ